MVSGGKFVTLLLVGPLFIVPSQRKKKDIYSIFYERKKQLSLLFVNDKNKNNFRYKFKHCNSYTKNSRDLSIIGIKRITEIYFLFKDRTSIQFVPFCSIKQFR